ncbi:hypothetical protein GOV07_03705 [Candidatus Woesearchaeota archaeon]|nr:hypothetical protein [Candidatus Woesearchaeota archaeon]
MKFAWYIITAVLLFLTIASAASADLIVNKYSNDFAVTSPYADSIKACACENRADLFTVTNTGNFPANYQADVLAEEDSWYALSIDEFTLAPGEHEDVIIYAEPGCGTVGEYTYSLKIESSYGRERIVTRDLDVKKCQNLFLTLAGGKNESNIGQPITYTLTLNNVAEFADTFVLDFGSFNDYADLEQRWYYLVPAQETTFNVTITPPVSLFGEVEIPFTVRSEKNKISEQRVAIVYIENQYDHEIVIPTQAEFCSRVDTNHVFKIRNLINFSNEFDIQVSGPGFVDYETKHITLDGLGEQNITLLVHPKKGQEGKYPVKIRVNSDVGDIRKTRTMEVDVFDCFAYELGYVSLEVKDGAYTDEACCGEKVYELNIKNNGQTEETYNVLIDGPVWFEPEEITVRLKPSENRNVKFNAQLPCTDETYEIPVTVWLTKHPDIRETVMFSVNSQTQRTCHAVDADAKRVRLDEEDKVIPFIVKHTGLEGGVYDIGVSSELYSHALEDKVTLEPGEEAVIHLQTVQNLSDYFDGRYVSTLTLKLEDGNISYYEPFWTDFKHVGWFTKAWRNVRYYDYGSLGPCVWSNILLFILAAVAIVTLLGLFGRNYKPFTYGWLITIRTILLIAMIVVAIALFTMALPEKAELYEEPIVDESGLVFQWYENERLTINLGDYFTDPDSDWLEYTATQPGNIAVVIDDDVATLIPERNWAGSDRIVFMASDQKGGVVDSPILALNVLKRNDLTFVQWMKRYCVHVTLSMLLVLLLALFLLSLLIFEPKRYVPYGIVLEAPKRPQGAVHTRVTRQGEITKLGEEKVVKKVVKAPKRRARKVVKRAVKKAPVKKTVKRPVKRVAVKKTKRMTAAQKAALSKALDRALVSSEPHEMRQVLRTHGKRGTEKNVKILQAELKKFKARKTYRPKNRKQFYRYLKEQKVLFRLQNIGTVKTVRKVVKKPVKKVAPAPKRSNDRKLVSSERHEMAQVLKTHGKKATARNIRILQEALSEFKKSRGFKPKNRKNFYRYIEEKDYLRRLHNR